MAKPALQSELSSIAEDLLTDDQAGHVPGDLPVEAGPEAGGVVRPFVRKENRRGEEQARPRSGPAKSIGMICRRVKWMKV